MKKVFFGFIALLLSAAVMAQSKSLPSATLKTLQGQALNAQDLGKSGKITVISFWATWCSPCKKELDAIKDYYDEWKEKYNVELVAISVDDARTAAKIPGMIEEKGWEYRILLDANKEFQIASNIASVPHTLLLDEKGAIVYEHVGYTPGDEVYLEEKIKGLKK